MKRQLMSNRPASWKSVLKAVRDSEACQPLARGVVAVADAALARPITKRAFSLSDAEAERIRAEMGEIGRERIELYALAMKDFANSGILERDLPALAAAAVLTGKQDNASRCVAQLDEAASWSPLQRPGWAHYLERVPMPKTGKEQAWLATGQSVRGIVTALDILPKGAINEDLDSRLRGLLQEEVRIISDDWKLKRSWFVECHSPSCNQWVLPTEGLIRACLWLGPDENREAYELGVANMREALDSHNPEGAWEEGLWYGAFSLDSICHAVRAMAVAGDDRLAQHPYLSRCAEWMVQCIQPAGHVMNAFDNILGRRGGRTMMLQPRVTMLADATGSEVACWALEHCLGGPSPTLPGLAVRVRGVSPKEPRLHGAYHGGGACVLWRSSWEEDASGVWIRGGHPKDSHNHHDRGHVNVILGGRLALMEAGTPMYSHPKMATHFSSAMGHNVLQIGSEPILPGINEVVAGNPPRGWQRRGSAPFEVHRLDDTGGDVSVDVSACYEEGVSWVRRVRWSADSVGVSDTVRLPQPDIPRFRWHLAAEKDAEVAVGRAADGKSATIRWPGFTMALSATTPFAIETEVLLDTTLAGTDYGGEHPGVVIRPEAATDAFSVEMTVAAASDWEA